MERKALSTAEARFIRLASREQTADAADRLARAAADICDWDAVVAQAAFHGVAAYLLQRTDETRVALPPTAAYALSAAVFAASAQTMLLDAELTTLAADLVRQSLTVMLLKGPVLSRTLYPDLRLRPYSDIDLNVRERDETAVVAALEGRGFHEVAYAAEEARRAHANHGCTDAAYHRVFVSERSGACVEVHTDPLQLGLPSVGEAGRWQRALPAPQWPDAVALCPEDQLVQLSVHVHKHGFSRLIWLKDIDLLVRRHGETLDWPLVTSVARSEGVTSSVWYSLVAARAAFDTPIPCATLRDLVPAAPIQALYRLAWPVVGILNLQGHMRRRAVQFHHAESWRGMVPSLVFMGRRGERLRAIVRTQVQRTIQAKRNAARDGV